jgi:membrane-associated phospholipid phosphatase
MQMNSLYRIISLISVIALVIVSYFFFDTGIAEYSGGLLRNYGMLATYASDIPDLLFPIACVTTGSSWAVYCLLKRNNISSPYARFFHLIGWTVPLSFILKTILKYVFGMANTRVWLANEAEYGFHWFQGNGNYGGFPSGHMAVFTVVVIAFIRFFPRFRLAGLFLLLILAAALIITDYHFLSDVIAGTYLGLIVDDFTSRVLEDRENKGA